MKAHQITNMISEAAYPDNLGFEEMVKFYRHATPDQTIELELAIRGNDWGKFKDLVRRVLGVTLHG